MNTIGKLFTTLTLLCLVVLAGCKKDDPAGPCDNFNFGTEIESELNAYTNAASAYFQNPSTQNCNAYKAAGIAYVDALEDLYDCAILNGQNQQSYQQSIDAARASFQGLAC